MINIHRIRYAKRADKKYMVYPIYFDDALDKLTEVNEEDERIGEPFRIIRGDLFEFYRLYDIDGKEVIA